MSLGASNSRIAFMAAGCAPLRGGLATIKSTSERSAFSCVAVAATSPARKRQFWAYIHHAGVGAIIVERAWAAPWMQVFGQMGLHGTPVGGMIVYRTA